MLFDLAKQEIFNQLRTALPQDVELVLETPPDSTLGDFAFPAFRLAKTLKKAPPIIAKELCEKLGANSKFSSKYEVKAAGPYLNFSVRKSVLVTEVLNSLLTSGSSLGEKKQNSPNTVVLEYSSPNVAKPFNIYHLRGTMIGNCLSRVFKARGYNCISINHLGDWGTQFGALTVAYELWGSEKELHVRGIPYLVELYVRINKEMETNKELHQKAREYFSRLEQGDEKITKIWKQFVDLSLQTYQKTYDRLGVQFDHYWGESFYIDKIPEIEQKLKQSKLLVESEGAQVVSLEEYNMPPCIVRKADGSTIYATRDLSAATYRYEKFKFSKMIYVVGGEQKLHFAQIFKVLDLMGFDWAKRCVHVDFGLYRFKDAKMSTRKGNFVTSLIVLLKELKKS